MAELSESERWRRVVDVLLAEARRLGDPAARARKLIEVGDVWSSRLADAQRASACYLDAVGIDPAVDEAALGRL
ncbi:MAG: hypothetical protein KC620_23160, partial [Myxococcales bacterium]|nr:hypothetical protein [Myxococcales bacterium]